MGGPPAVPIAMRNHVTGRPPPSVPALREKTRMNAMSRAFVGAPAAPTGGGRGPHTHIAESPPPPSSPIASSSPLMGASSSPQFGRSVLSVGIALKPSLFRESPRRSGSGAAPSPPLHKSSDGCAAAADDEAVKDGADVPLPRAERSRRARSPLAVRHPLLCSDIIRAVGFFIYVRFRDEVSSVSSFLRYWLEI